MNPTIIVLVPTASHDRHLSDDGKAKLEKATRKIANVLRQISGHFVIPFYPQSFFDFGIDVLREGLRRLGISCHGMFSRSSLLDGFHVPSGPIDETALANILRAQDQILSFVLDVIYGRIIIQANVVCAICGESSLDALVRSFLGTTAVTPENVIFLQVISTSSGFQVSLSDGKEVKKTIHLPREPGFFLARMLEL